MAEKRSRRSKIDRIIAATEAEYGNKMIIGGIRDDLCR